MKTILLIALTVLALLVAGCAIALRGNADVNLADPGEVLKGE